MDSAWHWLVDLAIILVLFVGIWRFSAIRTARSGNGLVAFALLCALGIVLYGNPLRNPAPVVLALLAGGAVGCLVAMRVNMIQIPAMVALQNGAGGLASFLTSFVELSRAGDDLLAVGQFSGALGIAIGAATFSGSMVAGAKLANKMRQTPVILPRHESILASILIAAFVSGLLVVLGSGSRLLYASGTLAMVSLGLGVVFSLWIGGADMPVLISFLNAASGLAASFCGIVIQNHLLIACGATVAASGLILTHAMCRAMNRNLLKVLLGIDWPNPSLAAGQGHPTEVRLPGGQSDRAAQESLREPIASSAANASSAEPVQASQEQRPKPPEISPLARAVEALGNAGKVIVVPGYGMALAHAQFEVAGLALRLKNAGKEVRFAIHPIAGRMPGHMHVLLAEAEVDPDILFDLREINSEFVEADVALIVGACDVVNPAAIQVQGTPISGMPILAAHEAKQVVVCNMDDQPGYSGVENPLYHDPKTILVLGDAKATVERLRQALNSGRDL